MNRIFRFELHRFRNITWIGSICMFLLLVFVHQASFTGLLQLDRGTRLVWMLFICSVSAVFGFWQMYSYRSGGLWAYLIHKPISPHAIFASLTAASLLTLACILILPFTLILIALDIFSADVIEIRRYLGLPYLFGISASFYFIGVLVALSARKVILFCFLLPFFFINEFSLGYWLFVVEVLIVSWLGFLAVRSFKSDLSQPPKARAEIFLTSVAVQVGLFLFLSFCLGLLYQIGHFIVVGHPSVKPRPGHFFEITRHFSDAQRMSYGLSKTDPAEAEYLQQQLELAEIASLWYTGGDMEWQAEDYNRSQQLHFADRGLTFIDDVNKIKWQFSMKHGVFIGQTLPAKSPVGALTLSGVKPLENLDPSDRFSQIPRIVRARENFLVGPHDVFQYDFKSQTLLRRFSVGEDELILSGLQRHKGFATIVSTKQLYLFDGYEVEKDLLPLTAFAWVAIPNQWKSLERISIAELVDGYVIEFIYGRNAINRPYRTSQSVFIATIAGDVKEISSQDIPFDYSELISHSGYWLSPFYFYTLEFLGNKYNAYDSSYMDASRLFRYLPPGNVLLLMGLMGLFAFAFTFYFAQRNGLNKHNTWSWSLCNSITGLPGVICFWLLTKGRA